MRQCLADEAPNHTGRERAKLALHLGVLLSILLLHPAEERPLLGSHDAASPVPFGSGSSISHSSPSNTPGHSSRALASGMRTDVPILTAGIAPA